MKTRIFTASIFLASVLFIASCSRSLDIRVFGSIDDAVIFELYDSPKSDTKKAFDVIEILVHAKVSESEWEIVWLLEGESSLDTIIYGSEYSGLEVKTPAQPLDKDLQYRILVTESTGLNPIGYTGIRFTFNNQGVPIGLSPNS